ncbi:ABC transporter permease/substrate-binding protein [Sphingomonas sp.]|jgi:osmoprotectant transport system permease protein|uniref:ABC transporter permease/substrate-binding protein n=1 Tax=Sphingomonas sp. TaxID=28214 RepID=UPI002E375F77|nr:ABC transporter permease/substrate-binding protein [Sphingomonas sp.]HEX4694231.1 ABC transporter permease/substrate-binding protein [Sphingomonas sp.]
MSDFLEALSRVPDLLAQHLLLAFAALALGIVLSLPLAVWSARRPAVGRVVLGFASLVQTIPSLALLALFYPILLSLSSLVGGGIPALGFLPSLLALTLYALLPILRNGVTGLLGIDPAVIEAADGVGMTPAQKLRLVEAPLVAPVLMAGIRTAAVWTIGAATLSTTVGQPSLGDMIFAGLQTQNWALVLAGCFAAAGLALAVDALLGVVEHGIARRKRGRVWIALGLLAACILIALTPMLPASKPTVTIGAKGFSEQYILARLIGHRLESAGYRVRYKEGLGSGVMFAALTASDIDIAIDYTGTIWTNQMKRTDTPPRDAMLAAITAWEGKQGLNLVGRLGFENAYCFAMRSDRAAALGVASLDDLAAKAADLTFASDPEFLERPEWKAVQAAYPIRFGAANAYSPTFMYRALASGRADVISAYTSDGRIAADRLTVLADPKGAIPNYDAILTLSPRLAHDPRVTAALHPLIGRIDVAAMREANYMVDRDAGKVSPDAAARWLEKRIGL